MDELLSRIRENEQAIAELERDSVAYPDMAGFRVSLSSLRRHHDELEDQLAALSDAAATDVCRYRLFRDSQDGVSLTGFTSALLDFQNLVSLVFDAVKRGPRRTGKITDESAIATCFNFGYTFAGSVGAVLTIPNERLLLLESDLDATVNLVFDMAKAGSSDQVAAFADRLGPAPIRSLYRWANAHVQDDLGADISWWRGDSIVTSVLVQTPELENLRWAICETSDRIVEEVELSGTLVGADVKRGQFHFSVPDVGDLSGKLGPAILSGGFRLQLPGHYTATFSKSTVVNYATDENKVTWELLSLQMSE